MNRLVAVIVAALVALLTVGLVSTASFAGTGESSATAAAGKKKKKKTCPAGTTKKVVKKKNGKKKVTCVPVVAPTPPAVPAPTGALTVSPTSFAFMDTHHGGECLTVADANCPDQVFTVTNTGAIPSGVPAASITMIQNGNVPVPMNRPGFKVSVNTCAAPLAPGGTCSLTVTFTPQSGGTFTGTLSVTGTPGGTASAGLSGVSNS